MASSALDKNIDQQIVIKLNPLGFEETPSGTLLVPIRPGWHGWLGLNHKIERNSYELNPVAGVRSSVLERTVKELTGRKYSPDFPPSLSTTLRYLVGNPWDSWIFREGADPSDTLDDIVKSMVDVGIPYMKEHSSLETIAKELAPGTPDASGTTFRYPVTLVLLGQRDEAMSYVQNHLESLKELPLIKGGYTELYRTFANSFFKFAFAPTDDAT
jgi:hypothetical protein